MTLRSLVEAPRRLVGRGEDHRERLDAVDARIAVTGVRGKSTAVRTLHDVLAKRGRDVLAKVTGDRPHVLVDGERHPIEREGRVTLHENERVLREYGPAEVAVLENQAISDYTNWVFNRYFADPQVVVVTNVRQDHRDTLGRTRRAIARSLARSIPEGAAVVTGVQDETCREVLDAELAARDARVIHVDVPERHRSVPGAEVVHVVDAVLEHGFGAPMADHLRRRLLDELRVEWTQLPNGRVYDAASANDVESTEAIRQSLERQDAPFVQPVVYLRPDRRARSDAFRSYLDDLYDRGKITHAHVVGQDAGTFARTADVPVVQHAPDADAAAVLDEVLEVDQPAMLMGNTVADFVRDLADEIERRARLADREAVATSTTASAAGAGASGTGSERGASEADAERAVADGGSGVDSPYGAAPTTSRTERVLRGSGD